jgi:hypothetical protein
VSLADDVQGMFAEFQMQAIDDHQLDLFTYALRQREERREWLTHPETRLRRKQWLRRWRADNAEMVRAKAREYAAAKYAADEAFRARERERVARYYQANRERRLVYAREYQARKRAEARAA